MLKKVETPNTVKHPAIQMKITCLLDKTVGHSTTRCNFHCRQCDTSPTAGNVSIGVKNSQTWRKTTYNQNFSSVHSTPRNVNNTYPRLSSLAHKLYWVCTWIFLESVWKIQVCAMSFYFEINYLINYWFMNTISITTILKRVFLYTWYCIDVLHHFDIVWWYYYM